MTSYPKTGNFNPGAAPGITASFLNNVEQWLGYAADSAITSDGSGNMTARSMTFNRGSIFEISFFGGNGTQSNVVHGCSGIPDLLIVMYTPAGHTSFGTEPTVIPHAEKWNATTTGIRAQTAYNWGAIAIRHL